MKNGTVNSAEQGRISPKTAKVLTGIFNFLAWSNFVGGIVAAILCIYLPIALTRLDRNFLSRVNQLRGAPLPKGKVDFQAEWPVIYALIQKFAATLAFQLRVATGIACLFVAWAIWRRASLLAKLAVCGELFSERAAQSVRTMTLLLLVCFGGYVSDLMLRPMAMTALSKVEWTWVVSYPYRLTGTEAPQREVVEDESVGGRSIEIIAKGAFGLVAPNFDGINSLVFAGLGFWFLRRTHSKKLCHR